LQRGIEEDFLIQPRFIESLLITHHLLNEQKMKWRIDVSDSRMEQKLRDNGGRRSGIDRRIFSYTDHIPERRSKLERRCGEDRRNQNDQTVEINQRSGLDRRAAFQV